MRNAFLLLLVFLNPLFALHAESEEGPAPKGGHGTMRLGVEAGMRDTMGLALGLSYRLGLHDLLDRQNGYEKDTGLEFAGARVLYLPRTSGFFLDTLTLLRVVHLPPLSASWNELSWKAEIGGRNLRDATCMDCGAGNLLGGLGATVEPFPLAPINFWFLMEAELLASTGFSGFPIKSSVGPRAGLRFRLRPWLNGMIYGLLRFQFGASVSRLAEWGTQWRLALARDFALNARLLQTAEGWETAVGGMVYF